MIPLGVTTAVSVADTGIHKKILGPGTARLIISNDQMEETMKIVNSLEDSGLLLQGVNEIIQIETKEQKGGFYSMRISYEVH